MPVSISICTDYRVSVSTWIFSETTQSSSCNCHWSSIVQKEGGGILTKMRAPGEFSQQWIVINNNKESVQPWQLAKHREREWNTSFATLNYYSRSTWKQQQTFTCTSSWSEYTWTVLRLENQWSGQLLSKFWGLQNANNLTVYKLIFKNPDPCNTQTKHNWIVSAISHT